MNDNNNNNTDDNIQLQLDHIVLATFDLEKAIQAFYTQTGGCQPVLGGSHLTWGTKNALVGIQCNHNDDQDYNKNAYVELLGPDPDNPGKPLGMSLLSLQEEQETKKMIENDDNDCQSSAGLLFAYHFAIRCNNLVGLQRRAKQLGFGVSDIVDMSRTTTSGQVLKWKLLFLQNKEFPLSSPDKETNNDTDKDDNSSSSPPLTMAAGILPFFIDWLDTEHPSGRLRKQPPPPSLTTTTTAVGEGEPEAYCQSVQVLLEVGPDMLNNNSNNAGNLFQLLQGIPGVECRNTMVRSRLCLSIGVQRSDTSSSSSSLQVIEYSSNTPQGIRLFD